MKTTSTLILAALLVVVGVHTQYSEAKGKSSRTSKSSKNASTLSTDIRFNGHDVGGKYQSPGEAVTTIEKEKPLTDLIEPRREFKDRLRKSVSQR